MSYVARIPHFRASARRTVNLPVTLATRAARSPARLLNLGLGGACIEASHPLAVGDAVTLEVTTPNLWDPLVVPSVVAWTAAADTGTRAGLAFDHAGKSALPALVELLSAYRFE